MINNRSLFQLGMNEARYGQDKEYSRIILDPVTKNLAEIKLNANGTSELLRKLHDRDTPPKATYDINSFTSFDEFAAPNESFNCHKKKAESLGLRVFKTEGYQTWWSERERELMEEDVSFFCLKSPTSKYEIHFTIESADHFLLIPIKTALHIMLIIAPLEEQGNFFGMAKLIQQFKTIFLDGAGVPLAFGRSHARNQYEVSASRNWRKDKTRITSLMTGEKSLEDEKLTLMYMRAGFIKAESQEEDFPTIYLLSDAFKEKVKATEAGKWLKDKLKFSRYEKQ